jgi:2-polyprenyl-6-methoxyphenol hydroxylase-like FAD-dependent oxidoreductase
LTLPADNDTWSLTLFSSPHDAPLRALRDPAVFERVVRSFPMHEHWLDGAPIGDVTMMSGAVDRRRRFVVDGAPVVTGFLAVGDSHVCTNPSLGRGMTMGLRHAEVLVDVVRDHGTAPVDVAEAFDKATAAVIGPWYDATVAVDRSRFTEMEAARVGESVEPTGPAAVGRALQRAATVDQRAARWLAELIACVSLPEELFSRPGVVQTVLSIEAEGRHRDVPGPDRAELLGLVGAGGG